MSDPRPGTGDAKAPDVAQLLRDLAARERQLRDLTEQSLGFLEELAESRRLNGEREQLVARLADLERSLADAKTRLRHAGGAATAPAATGKGAKAKVRPAFEVVVWGIAPRDASQAAKTAGVPVVWVGVPDALVAGESLDGVSTVVHRDARTPAQCWNLGMSSTTADAVLFVGPGVRAEAAPKLPDNLPANAAILCPRIVRGESASIGAEQVDDVMRLRARQIADADLANSEPFFRVQHADAAAFVVRRAAFERIGTFDEGLLGPAALLEYGLRARRANFDVLGVPGIVATASADDREASFEADDRENLTVVAMHRPEQLGRALASTALPWNLSSAEMPGFLAQLFARLPAAGDLAQQRGIVERLASGLAQHALPATHVVERLQRARITLLERFADAGTVANREDFVAAARRVANERLTDPAIGFDAFASEIAFCAEAATATARQLEATRNELRSLDAERHAQSDRAERADGARQLAEKQLEQVQQWLLEARREIADLQKTALAAAAALTESERAKAEVERVRSEEQHGRAAVERAKAEVEARLAESLRGSDGVATELRDLQARFAALQAELATAKDRQREMEQLHDEEIQKHWEFERQHLVLKAQYLGLEREHIDADANAREMREQIAHVKEVLGLPVTATSDAFAERLENVGTHWKRLSAVLSTTGAGGADDLANRLAESESLVRDRERWIARLLHEVMQRRLFPRELQDHERALVERVGRSS